MRLILLLFLSLFARPALAEIPALSEYVWAARPVIIFADRAEDPRFIRQMEFLSAYPDDLAERDVVVLTDTDPEANGPLRQALHPRGFMLVVIDKDGTIAFRKPAPWTVRELSRAIDKTPIRLDEINEALGK
jgi:hypothetical protein